MTWHTQKIHIGGTLELITETWESFPAEVSFKFVEHATDHWSSNTETEITVTKEVAEKLVAELKERFNIV